VHVAHAFTVHAEESESDYFSAVDDLLQVGEDAELGSGHIGTTELTSGLYYGYVVVDVPLLVSNLTGCDVKAWAEQDRGLAGDVVDRLIRLIATVSPGAKLGSTAPHAYAQLMLVEAGSSQPRTLANAFLKPVSERPDLLSNTYSSLLRHLDDLDGMYGRSTERRLAAQDPTGALAEAAANATLPRFEAGDGAPSLDQLAQWAAAQVRGG
jgi:CRISPR system Cascade subunit CasC